MIAQYMPRYAQFIPKMCHRCFSNIPKICPKRQRWAESPLEWSSANFVNRGWMAARRQRIGASLGIVATVALWSTETQLSTGEKTIT